MSIEKSREELIEEVKLLRERLAELESVASRERNERSEAEAANRLKDEFLATVSHELRTPLTSILGWAQLLRSNRFDEAASAQALESIERNAKAQARIVDDLLDISYIIAGKLNLDAGWVELLPVVESAINEVHHTANAKGIKLRMVLDPGAGSIFGDQYRLQQIVMNLLTNALKFTPRGGRVEVRLERVNSHIEIAVSDTGKGISLDFLPHIFEQFRQADSSITREYGGLGLGLAIVRHLVELHGGTIEAASTGEGRGSTFTIKLPLMGLNMELGDTGMPSSRGARLLKPHPEITGLRVLVVDDELDTIGVLTAILEQRGVKIKTATSAAEATEIFERWIPDVLISDIGMPEEDGYELIKRVRMRGAERGGNVPAVALTAYARAEDRNRALLAGYQMHLAKPVENDALIAAIAGLAGRGPVVGD